MITYPEIRVDKQGCRIIVLRSFVSWGHSLFVVFYSYPGIISVIVPLFEGPFQGSFLFVCNGF